MSIKPGWLNRDTDGAIKRKHKAWNKFKKHSTPENWAIFTQERNHATHLVSKSKSNFENNLASEIKSEKILAICQ